MLAEEETSTFTKEDIRFDFEDFLEDNEQNLPEGLDPLYLSYMKNLEEPIKNIGKLRRTFYTLPVNALLHQQWNAIWQILGIIFLLSLPSISMLIYLASHYDRGLIVGFSLFFIILGIAASPVYLKTIYSTLNDLVESKKAPWLVEEIKEPFDELYQSKWNRKILKFAFGTTFLIDLKMTQLIFFPPDGVVLFISIAAKIISVLLILLGHVGITIMLYLSMISFYFVVRNTRIYDLLLVRIIKRVRGYTDGHESILTKKNYEVVRVLSDTPGLSIRSLAQIPQLGLLSSIATFNGIIFLLLSPFLIHGNIATVLDSIPHIGKDNTNLTILLILSIIISALASFGAVIMPLFRISRAMNKFKTKALVELDPFLFDEITSLALKRETEISNETQILYILRSYIYTMKISPVPPFRLIQLVALSLLYGFRIVPTIIGVLDSLGG
ncbi:MAG: hypothetical protein INQ03_05300 [Candidatus Heimdallarchaeota archaeon]|nr:hypothetical protein [Candidatus Heimdallarchaeota archaeon]